MNELSCVFALFTNHNAPIPILVSGMKIECIMKEGGTFGNSFAIGNPSLSLASNLEMYINH